MDWANVRPWRWIGLTLAHSAASASIVSTQIVPCHRTAPRPGQADARSSAPLALPKGPPKLKFSCIACAAAVDSQTNQDVGQGKPQPGQKPSLTPTAPRSHPGNPRPPGTVDSGTNLHARPLSRPSPSRGVTPAHGLFGEGWGRGLPGWERGAVGVGEGS